MERAELFRLTSYKELLRQKHKEEIKRSPRMTWKFIAGKVRIQPTYLSRSFSHDEVHLNEDHLFEILELLKIDDVERDYILLLRAQEIATSRVRREHLQGKIEALRRGHVVKVDSIRAEASPDEMAFLLNPFHLLIYVSLHVKKYAKAPLLLARVFNLKNSQVEEILHHLNKMQLIRYDHDKGVVVEVKANKMHFTKEHPLMRGHQQVLRHLSAERVARTEETNRVSFMATFSAPAEAFEKIKADFYEFLNQAQKHAARADGEKVFQIGFDLFPWES